jgi:hypothetical protein
MVVVSPTTAGRICCSLSGFNYLSHWQRSVRRWKRRDPHVEWPGSVVFTGVTTRVLCWNFIGSGVHWPCVCAAWGGWSHGGGAQDVALACSGPCLSAWHIVGDDDAVHGWLLLAPLPVCGCVVFCSVCCWCPFVEWWCSLRCVMYNCFFFSYDVAVLLPFIKKKSWALIGLMPKIQKLMLYRSS